MHNFGRKLVHRQMNQTGIPQRFKPSPGGMVHNSHVDLPVWFREVDGLRALKHLVIFANCAQGSSRVVIDVPSPSHEMPLSPFIWFSSHTKTDLQCTLPEHGS